MSKYKERHCKMTVKESHDVLVVEKNTHSNWCEIYTTTNGIEGHITLRSQAMVEQLHFMLGKMLSGIDKP